MRAKELLQRLKEAHPNYDPNWDGSSTYSEDFVLKAMEVSKRMERERIRQIDLGRDGSMINPNEILEQIKLEELGYDKGGFCGTGI